MSELTDQIYQLLNETVESRPGVHRLLVGGEARNLLVRAAETVAHLEERVHSLSSLLVESEGALKISTQLCDRLEDERVRSNAEVDRLVEQQDALLAALVRAEGSES